MDDALYCGTAIVEGRHGKVLQYAGDSILAAFGADEAREDDTERAVHCGLALLELGRVLGAEMRAHTATPASASAWESTPAACCLAAASMPTARSAVAR
jgi:class 3 adenylate cyclase